MCTTDRSLAECPFPRLLSELSRHQATGTLLLSSGATEKRILFQSGVPVHIDSSSPLDSLDNFLVARGELDASAATEALSTAEAEQRSVGEVLVQMGAMEPHALFTALKRHLGKQILSVFSWESGSSRFDDCEADIDHLLVIKVKPAPLILRGVCSFTTIGIIQKDFSGQLDQPHKLRASARSEVGGLHLNTKESRVVNALSRPRSLLDLCGEVGADQELVLRVIYSLSVLDMLEVIRESSEVGTASRITVLPPRKTLVPKLSRPDTARPDTARPDTVRPDTVRPDTVRPDTARSSRPNNHSQVPSRAQSNSDSGPSLVVNFSNSSAGATTPAPETYETAIQEVPTRLKGDRIVLTPEERNQIDSAYITSKTGNYLELLGVRKGFSFAMLKDAFLKQCTLYSPVAYQGRDTGEQGERIEELFLTLVRAFSVLSLPSTRAEYLDSLGQRAARTSTTTTATPRRATPRRATTRAATDGITKTRAATARAATIRCAPLPVATNTFAVREPSGCNGTVKTAVSLLNMGEAPEAALALHAAYKSDARDPYTCAFFGYALYLADPVSKGKDALRLLRKAIQLDPTLSYLHILLARVCDFQQDYQGALDAFQGCLAIVPDEPEASSALARLSKLVK